MLKKFGKYLGLGILSTFLTATPGLGAERISFFYPPFGEFSLSVDSLETFAKEGKINDDLAFYASRATPQQLAQLRDLLQQRFNVTPTLISQVTYSPLGEDIVKRLGKLLLTETRQNGDKAIRAAMILAAADEKEGFTVVNLLRRFPSQTVRLNFTEGLQIVEQLSQLLKRRDQIVKFVQNEGLRIALTTAAPKTQAANTNVNVSPEPDLRSPGNFTWDQTTLQLYDNTRDRRLPVDIYLPTTAKRGSDIPSPLPLVVISHGVASDRYAFIYIAEHLASHGFAVAVLEHPGSNAERFQQYFSGLAGPPDAREFINRPLDIKYLLDELQRLDKSNPTIKGKLNFQQIAAIGQSFGGYTVLTLAGAKINFEQLRQDCFPNESLNLSLFLQCRAADLPPANYQLKDDRIRAIMAINPIDSTVLGKSGISQIQIPVMLVAGSQDIFAPPVPEQIRPFTWLSSPNKYLAVIENATHFTAIAETRGNNVLPVPQALIGPEREAAYGYLKALSLAFLETHLRNRPEYSSYLQPSYAHSISQAPLNLSLLNSLSAEQLTQVLNQLSPQTNQQSPQ